MAQSLEQEANKINDKTIIFRNFINTSSNSAPNKRSQTLYGNILNNSEVLISNIDNSIPAVFSCSSLLSLFNKETPTSSKINKYDNTINLNETHEKKSDDDIIIK